MALSHAMRQSFSGFFLAKVALFVHADTMGATDRRSSFCGFARTALWFASNVLTSHAQIILQLVPVIFGLCLCFSLSL